MAPWAAAVGEHEAGEVLGSDAAVGIEIEIPQVVGLVRPLAIRLLEDALVEQIDVAIAIGIAEQPEELIDPIAAGNAVAIRVEQPAIRVANLVAVNHEPVAAVGK